MAMAEVRERDRRRVKKGAVKSIVVVLVTTDTTVAR